jgi:hypothetical protein
MRGRREGSGIHEEYVSDTQILDEGGEYGIKAKSACNLETSLFLGSHFNTYDSRLCHCGQHDISALVMWISPRIETSNTERGKGMYFMYISEGKVDKRGRSGDWEGWGESKE